MTLASELRSEYQQQLEFLLPRFIASKKQRPPEHFWRGNVMVPYQHHPLRIFPAKTRYREEYQELAGWKIPGTTADRDDGLEVDWYILEDGSFCYENILTARNHWTGKVVWTKNIESRLTIYSPDMRTPSLAVIVRVLEVELANT